MTETDLHQIETDNLSLDDVRAQQAVAELVAEVRRRCAVQADLQAACQAALLLSPAPTGKSETAM